VKDKARKLMKKIKDQYNIEISEEDFDAGKIRKVNSLESMAIIKGLQLTICLTLVLV